MARYLISFPSAAMVVPNGECQTVGRDSLAVIDEALKWNLRDESHRSDDQRPLPIAPSNATDLPPQPR